MTQRRTSRCWLVLICLALLLGGLVVTPPAPVAAANTLHVTDCGDAGATTLRGQIAAAAAGDTIVFDRDCTGTTAITLATGRLMLTQDVTIDGTGHAVTVDGGCTVSGGVCTSGGVQVFVVNSGVTVSLTALTIQNGVATNAKGGGIDNEGGTLTVTNSTLSRNRSTARPGGGIYIGTNVRMTNTIVADNTAAQGGPDVSGVPSSGGHNLVGIVTDDSMGWIATDLTGTIASPLNALLGSMGINGGPTQTISLLPGSPAIAHGDPAVCASTTAPAAAPVAEKDQRGVTRPTTLCAIGAFEPLLSLISRSVGPTAGGTAVTLYGAGFAAGATVNIGGVSCTNVQIVNSTTLTCTTGAHAAGVVDVVVTVTSQTGTLAGGYTYGTVTALPGAKPPGGSPGSPSPLPGARPTGTKGGSAPNPLPAARP